MKAQHALLALLCLAGVAKWMSSSPSDHGPGNVRLIGDSSHQGDKRNNDGAASRVPVPTPGVQQSLGGFVAVWSTRGSDAPVAADPAPRRVTASKAETGAQRNELAAVHAREVATVSVRILELLAQQNPAKASTYLAEANRLQANPTPALPPLSSQRQEAVERQRQLNADMSARMAQLLASQRSLAATGDNATAAATPHMLRPGDQLPPRSGDIAGRIRQ